MENYFEGIITYVDSNPDNILKIFIKGDCCRLDFEYSKKLTFSTIYTQNNKWEIDFSEQSIVSIVKDQNTNQKLSLEENLNEQIKILAHECYAATIILSYEEKKQFQHYKIFCSQKIPLHPKLKNLYLPFQTCNLPLKISSFWEENRNHKYHSTHTAIDINESEVSEFFFENPQNIFKSFKNFTADEYLILKNEEWEKRKEKFEAHSLNIKISNERTMTITLNILCQEANYKPPKHIMEKPFENSGEIFKFMNKIQPDSLKSKVFSKIGTAVLKDIKDRKKE